MKNIKKIEVEGEQLSLKKTRWGYKVVHPVKDEEGKTIWINLLVGGWENFVILIFCLLVVFSFIYGMMELTTTCKDVIENPCKYTNKDCATWRDITPPEIMLPQINFTEKIPEI